MTPNEHKTLLMTNSKETLVSMLLQSQESNLKLVKEQVALENLCLSYGCVVLAQEVKRVRQEGEYSYMDCGGKL